MKAGLSECSHRTAALQTAEGALTGESVPVDKDALALDEEAVLGDRHNMVFSGTTVTTGHRGGDDRHQRRRRLSGSLRPRGR